MAMTQPSITLTGVTAGYGHGRAPALRDVSLTVQPGEIFGLLGPNGAGKSTLLACVEGLHRPSAGRVTVGGYDVQRQPTEVKRLLGIQLQKTALLDDLTVGELLEVYAALYEVFLTPAQTDAFLGRFDLREQRRSLARRLSGGQQQRLALALAVTNNPQIVLLDEPTSALDPHARRAVWDNIRQMHDDGRTIVLTTHAMEEAEALCGRVAIIDQGQIVACDTPAQLVAGLGAHPVLKAAIELPLAEARALPGVQMARYAGQHLELETAEPQLTLAALHAHAAQTGRGLSDVRLRQPNLEDVFLALTGRALADGQSL